jgi:hypothetical protein
VDGQPCVRCGGEGWICEAHPDLIWPHGDCAGPGQPCPLCNTRNPPRIPRDWVSLASVDDGEDKRAQHQRALLHNAPQGAPRQPSPGEEVWRVQTPEGAVHSCELRDHSRHGSGWELQILTNGEILVCRQCDSEQHARRVADMAKGDYLRQDCVALEKGGA